MRIKNNRITHDIKGRLGALSRFRSSAPVLILSTLVIVASATANAKSDNTILNRKATQIEQITEKRHRRIVALAPHIVESLFDIGAGEQIIATTEHSDYPPAANQIPRIGNYAGLQIEQIVALQPDLVIAWRTGNPESDLMRLERYDVNVVYSDARDLQDVAEEIRLLGRLTGRSERAETLANDFTKRLNTLRHKFASREKIRGFYEMWAKPLRTVARRAWLQQQLEVCAVANPFADAIEDYPLVSLEKVLASHPQVIIQPSAHTKTGTEALQWSKWPSVPAVKNNFIFQPNADKTHRMTRRMLDELDVLCHNIDQARDFYLKY